MARQDNLSVMLEMLDRHEQAIAKLRSEVQARDEDVTYVKDRLRDVLAILEDMRPHNQARDAQVERLWREIERIEGVLAAMTDQNQSRDEAIHALSERQPA